MNDKPNVKTAIEHADELCRRVLEDPRRTLSTIQAYYAEQVRQGDPEAAHLALAIRTMMMEQERVLMDSRIPQSSVPSWFSVAGFATSGATLLFFMALVVASTFGKEVPLGSRFLVVIVMALGTALSSAFLGGSAVASGKIPIFKDSPLTFSVGGGIAVFVIVLALGKALYV
jgi:hypothetical protein